MHRKRIAPQSEVIRAIVFEDGPVLSESGSAQVEVRIALRRTRVGSACWHWNGYAALCTTRMQDPPRLLRRVASPASFFAFASATCRPQSTVRQQAEAATWSCACILVAFACERSLIVPSWACGHVGVCTTWAPVQANGNVLPQSRTRASSASDSAFACASDSALAASVFASAAASCDREQRSVRIVSTRSITLLAWPIICWRTGAAPYLSHAKRALYGRDASSFFHAGERFGRGLTAASRAFSSAFALASAIAFNRAASTSTATRTSSSAFLFSSVCSASSVSHSLSVAVTGSPSFTRRAAAAAAFSAAALAAAAASFSARSLSALAFTSFLAAAAFSEVRPESA